MSLKRVYVKEKEVFPLAINSMKYEDVPQSNRVKTTYRIFKASTRGESEFFIVVEGLKNSDKVEGKQAVTFPKGFYFENRSVVFDGKTYNEVVVVAPELRALN